MSRLSRATPAAPAQHSLIRSLVHATAALSLSAPEAAALTRPSPKCQSSLARRFGTTSSALNKGQQQQQAKGKAGGVTSKAEERARRRSKKKVALSPKVAGMMKFIYAASQVPPPLRMARNRWLRHWTIHRAWLLHRRHEAARRERELMQLQQSMAHACETLRNLAGPGSQPLGWLYRKAMEHKGVWGLNAVPIEYARPLVETPGHRVWNHEWKRS